MDLGPRPSPTSNVFLIFFGKEWGLLSLAWQIVYVIKFRKPACMQNQFISIEPVYFNRFEEPYFNRFKELYISIDLDPVNNPLSYIGFGELNGRMGLS